VNRSLLSDLDLARLERPGESDVTLVRRLALQAVCELELAAPVDPGLVASYRGISRVEEVDQPWAGCLTHDGEETVARVRAGDSPRRKRFTTLHEVEHTYLPGFTVTQYRCDPSPSAPHKGREPVEKLADVGASELMFPRDQFLADLAGNRIGFDLVEDLADHYDASLGATALRVVSLAPTDSLLICVEPGVKPTQPHAEPLPRIRWSSANGEWPYIPRHKSIPNGGPMHRAMHGELVDGIDDLPGLTSSPIHHVDISCRLYPYVDSQGEIRDRVLCLVTRQQKGHGVAS
jgi:hypothetical protein